MSNQTPQPGDPLKVSANWVGRVNSKLANTRSVDPRKTFAKNGIINCVNDTGDDLDAFAVVQIIGVFKNESDDENLFKFDYNFIAKTPTKQYENYAMGGVCQEPIKKDGVGRVLIDGFTPCQVYINREASDMYCKFTDTHDHMDSAPWGMAYIAYAPAGTGVQWCLIKMNCAPILPTVWIAMDDADYSAGTVLCAPLSDSGSVDITKEQTLPYFKDKVWDIRKYDVLMLAQSQDDYNSTAVVAVCGNDSSDYPMPMGTNQTADTHQWDIDNQPSGDSGVTIPIITRTYWQGMGYPVLYFQRKFTFDSKGALTFIDIEEQKTIADTGNCS